MKIYIIKNDMRLGPFTLEEAKQQGITANTLVWHKGMPDWKEACTVPELADAIVPDTPISNTDTAYTDFGDDDGDTPPEAPVHEPEYGQASTPQEPPRRYAYDRHDDDTQSDKSKKSKTAIITLIVALMVMGIMMLTKPSKDEYVDTITERTTDYIIGQIGSNSEAADPESIDGTVKYTTSKMVRELLEQSIEVDDYFIFNKAKVQIGELSLSVGFGMFSHVFTLDKDELALIVDKYMEKQRAKAPSKVRETIDSTIEMGKQKAEELGIDSKAIDAALDSITTKAEEKGGEVVDKVVEQAKEKGKEAINDLMNELNK